MYISEYLKILKKDYTINKFKKPDQLFNSYYAGMFDEHLLFKNLLQIDIYDLAFKEFHFKIDKLIDKLK